MDAKPRYLDDGDHWILAEEIPDIDFQFSQIWLSSFVNDIHRTIGIDYKKVLCVYSKGYNLAFYYGEKDSELVSNIILRKIIEEDFAPTINQNIRHVADELFSLCEKITPEYLARLDNKALVELYQEMDRIHTDFYVWCWLPNAVDMFHAHFTGHLKNLLVERLGSEEKANASLVALSFSEDKSFAQEEPDSLLEMAIYKKHHPEDKATFEKMLKRHHGTFFYLKHLWIGKEGVSTIDEYRRAVEKILTESDPEKVLTHEEQKREEDRKERDRYEKELGLSEKEQRLFRAYAEFAFTKSYRRKVQLYWAYKMDFLFTNLSKRLGISFMESRFLTPDEVFTGLENGLSSKMKETVTLRTQHCVYYAEKGLEIVLTGEKCKEFEETIHEEIDDEIHEFSGQVAFVGKVRGPVKIVNTISDMHKVIEGDVLVSIATNPDILPAMKKAVAFVTEQGGITSHAAIVSREMKKPCIVGTKIATKVLKDGDIVEVDAEKGIVRILERALVQ